MTNSPPLLRSLDYRSLRDGLTSRALCRHPLLHRWLVNGQATALPPSEASHPIRPRPKGTTPPSSRSTRRSDADRPAYPSFADPLPLGAPDRVAELFGRRNGGHLLASFRSLSAASLQGSFPGRKLTNLSADEGFGASNLVGASTNSAAPTVQNLTGSLDSIAERLRRSGHRRSLHSRKRRRPR